ncbi:MAG TPA: hypothetical protein VFC09_07035 [Candidatus Dormibacteraeota bacterium]|nr:hypothetical protein [Candidatus Dormibacteraeota bacterium]
MTSPAAPSPRRIRLAASGGVLLALAGVWLGHTIEYWRVNGAAGLGRVMVGSLHAYMLPVGMLLALAAAAGAMHGLRLWLRLGRQLGGLRPALAGALRGHRVAAAPRRVEATWRPRGGVRIAAWWLPLTVLQIGLYLFQENVEAGIAGAPAPGFGAVTGVHALAPLVHAAVALLLLAAVALGSRLLHRRVEAVERTIALLRHLLDRLGSMRPQAPRAAAAVRPAPLDRFGRLWSRPPPALHSA